MVDGKDLTKIFRVNIKLLKSVRDRTINEENYVDIEPRNSKYSVLS
jgi:hypothetical protein